MRKPCSNCGRVKDLAEDFGKDKSRPDGYTHNCKECRNKASKLWSERNPQQAKTSKAKWQKENIERKRAADRAYKDRKRSELEE